MKPTRPLLLIGWGLAVALLAFGGAGVLDAYATLPDVPYSAPTALGAFALIVLMLALTLRSRLRAIRERRPGARPVDPLQAARAAMLARASCVVGALAAGLYLGYGIYLVRDLDIGALRERAVMCLASVVGGVLLAAAGYFLERVCRLPKPPHHGHEPDDVRTREHLGAPHEPRHMGGSRH